MSSLVKKPEEIAKMRQGGRILATVLYNVAQAVQPGIATSELDSLAKQGLLTLKAKPSFLGYKNENGQAYPASLCTSVNAEVVHGIPGTSKILKEGDIIGLDLGCWYQGLCTDMAITVPVGKISPLAKRLIKVTKRSLELALKQVRAGATIGDIGEAAQAYVEHEGFSVVRQLTGHGVGRAVHEEPAIPNFGQAGRGQKLISGMTLAIEPMVNAGQYEVMTKKDGWTVATVDGSLAAHFENTVAVTANGYEILTDL